MTVTIDLLHHRGEVCYALRYEHTRLLRQRLASLSFLWYSTTLRCYYVYARKWSLEETAAILHAAGISVQYGSIVGKQSHLATVVLSVRGAGLLNEYLSYLEGLRLSASTIQAYALFVKHFIIFIQNKPITALTNTDVRLFVEAEVKKNHYSISSHRQMISGLKHFATLHLESGLVPDDLKRPSSSKYLPTVLSKEEVIDILRVTKNLKHRTALALLYSSGLRIGELIALELRRIDIDRRQLFVKNSKNRRDRVVILAESFIPLFRNYYATYQPKKYFIENPNGGLYNPGSIRNFLRRSCKAAGISKRVTPHTLRHSYATHMIENGVGLRYVQDLLGHAKPETTMIYTHVAKKDLLHIQSPLDTALQSLTTSDNHTPELPLSSNIIR